MERNEALGAPVRLPCWFWAPQDRKTAWLCATLTIVSIFYLIGTVEVNLRTTEPYPFSDFFALWSYAQIALTHPVAELYDMEKLHKAQVMLGMLPDAQFPFPYPPQFLLYIWPLGFLSFYAAYAFWMAVTLLLYLLATCVGAHGKAALACTALLAPATTACLGVGQSGFLLAALLVGGLRLIPRHPILGGILFGLLTYKAQFGVLVPLALIAGGQWRCIAAACATTVGLIIVTMAAFGVSIWETWWQALHAYAASFDSEMAAHQLMPTVLTNLQMLGLPQDIARAGQSAAALVAAVVVWRAWRRLSRELAVPVLLAATCLATPHAFIYDLPILSSAVILFSAHRLRSTGSLVLPEVGVLILVLAIPEIMSIRDIRAPISTVAISLFLALVLATGRATNRSSSRISLIGQAQEAA